MPITKMDSCVRAERGEGRPGSWDITGRDRQAAQRDRRWDGVGVEWRERSVVGTGDGVGVGGERIRHRPVARRLARGPVKSQVARRAPVADAC